MGSSSYSHVAASASAMSSTLEPSSYFSGTSNSFPRWIIDSKATDHMTGTSSLSIMFLVLAKIKVKLADGSLSSISGKD